MLLDRGNGKSGHAAVHPMVSGPWEIRTDLPKPNGARAAQPISKNRMATLLKTSRTQVDRLLDAKDDITLSSLQRAAAIVGRRVTIELV
jgi:hypothetical protein